MYEKVAMRRREVESSNIKSIGHSFPRRLLEIEFKDGNVYRYKGVNNKTYKALMNAESKGKEFHKNIKYSYPYKKYKDKEGNKMDGRYEMLVKQAYEEILDSFEKEAKTIESCKDEEHPYGNKLGLKHVIADVAPKFTGRVLSTTLGIVGAEKVFNSKVPKYARLGVSAAIDGLSTASDWTKASDIRNLSYLPSEEQKRIHSRIEDAKVEYDLARKSKDKDRISAAAKERFDANVEMGRGIARGAKIRKEEKRKA